MFLLTVRRRQGCTHTHIHMTRTHTHTHTHMHVRTTRPPPSSSADRHWAKVHSATVLTISLSPPLSLSLSLLHAVSFSRSAFSRKVPTSSPSLLPLPSLSLSVSKGYRPSLASPSFLSPLYLSFQGEDVTMSFGLCLASAPLSVPPCVSEQ